MFRKIIVSVLLISGLLLTEIAPALAAGGQYADVPVSPSIEEPTAEQPASTETPMPTELPQPSESQAPTEQPAVSEEPPQPSESQVPSEQPAVSEEPQTPAAEHLTHSGEVQPASDEQPTAAPESMAAAESMATVQMQTPEAMNTTGIVRVMLSTGNTAALSFFVDGNYTLNGAPLERQLYTIKLEGGTLNLYFGGVWMTSGSTLRLVQHTAADGRNNFIVLNNTKWKTYLGYLGDMEFSISGSSICAVNHIYMEDYLYGVVPWEMSDSYPVEALKAQAVSARTYTEMEMNSSDPYDLVDDSEVNQAYKGFNKDMARSIQAVDQTAKIILSSDGTNPAETYYSASNGGITEIPQHIWNKDNPIKPYQVIKQDDADIQNLLCKMDVLILPKNLTGGAQITYQYNDDSKDNKGIIYTGVNEGIKATNYFHDSALLKVQSMGYTSLDAMTAVNSITPQPLGGQHNILDYSGSNACGRSRYATVNMTVTATRIDIGTGLPVQESIAIDFLIDFELMADEHSPNCFVFDEHPTLRLFTVVDDGTNIYIYHRGFGQGLGLSQRGAQQRANSADPAVNTYDKILDFYYPSTARVTQTYGRTALTPAAAPDHTNALITGDVNVRSVPTTASNTPIWMMLKGGRIEVVQPNVAVTGSTTWHKIYFGGQYAYIAASYVQLDSSPSRGTVTVWFEANGGSPVAAQTLNHADSVVSPPATSKVGYMFAGWFTDPGLTNPVSFPYIAASDAALYAKWIEANCTVSIDPQNGSGAASSTVPYGSILQAPVQPSRFGYNFTGWYAGSGAVSFPYAVTSSVAIYAGWAPQPATNYLVNVIPSSGYLNRGFSPTVTSYKITIGENDSSFTLTPIKQYDGATMTINGQSKPSHTVSITNGKSAKITVKVTYAKKSKTYTFTVTRAKSSNNYLSSLTAPGAWSQAFNPNVMNYTLYLDENTKGTTITALKASSVASVSPSSAKVTLNNGAYKDVKITVKAQSGVKRTYTIRVVRAASSNTSLKSLKASGLTPRFSPGNTNYSVTLPASKGGVTISAGAAGYKAVVYLNGQRKSSLNVIVSNGQSVPVRVTVVSQAGTAQDYWITVTRQ